MVEVHVGQNDVADIFGLEPQFFDLVDGRFLRVEGHFGDDSVTFTNLTYREKE